MWRRLEEAGAAAIVHLAKERTQAERWMGKLLALPAEEQTARLHCDRRYRTRALAALLLERSRTAAAESEQLAGLVLAIVAEGLHERNGDGSDLAVAAHCQIGDARRSRGELDGAEEAFLAAARCLEGSVDTEERARYCLLLAALRRDQVRSDEALALWGRGAELLRDLGSTRARAEALLEFGLVALDVGEPERALAALLEAGCEAQSAPGMACRWAKAVAMALTFEGQMEEAHGVLEEMRSFHGWHETSPEGIDLLAWERWLAQPFGREIELRRSSQGRPR